MADLVRALADAGWGLGLFLLLLALIAAVAVVRIGDMLTGGPEARARAREATATARAHEALTRRQEPGGRE